MTCSEAIAEVISRGGNAIAPDVGAHLAHCESCQQLVRALAEAREAAPVTGRIEQIKSVLLADLRPVKPLSSSLTLLGLLSLVFLAIAGSGSLFVGFRGWQALAAHVRVLVFAPLLMGAYLLALGLVRQMVPGGGRPTAPLTWTSITFASLLLAIVLVFDRREDPRLISHGFHCFRLGLMYAASAGLMVWLVIRRGAILSAPLMGAMAGGLAGFIALAGSELRCPNPNGNHILIWHMSLVLAGALGGLAVGAAGFLLTSWRDRSYFPARRI